MTFTRGRSDSVTRDHIIPLSKGGAAGRSNIVAACFSRNTERETMDAELFFELKQAASVATTRLAPPGNGSGPTPAAAIAGTAGTCAS
jgi:hypothetical protein